MTKDPTPPWLPPPPPPPRLIPVPFPLPFPPAPPPGLGSGGARRAPVVSRGVAGRETGEGVDDQGPHGGLAASALAAPPRDRGRVRLRVPPRLPRGADASRQPLRDALAVGSLVI